jgi:hypothetical protein
MGQPFGQRVVFWLLLAMAFSVFAPCVVLPVRRDLIELERQEGRLINVVSMLEAEKLRGDYIIDQLRTNPIHVKKMAERIGVRGDDEFHVAITPAPLEAANSALGDRVSTTPGDPGSVKRGSIISDMFSGDAWRRAILDRDRRRAMLVLSAIAIAAAFALFGDVVGEPEPSSRNRLTSVPRPVN